MGGPLRRIRRERTFRELPLWGSCHGSAVTERVILLGGSPLDVVYGRAMCQRETGTPHPKHASGSRGVPSQRISKWQCGPVDRPVEPISATGSPCATQSPTDTSSAEQCA